MALPACLHLADTVFPRVRAEASRRLASSGLSQARIASILGVSQAMVSKYQARIDPENDPLVLRMATELVAAIEHPDPEAEPGPSAWCSTLTMRHDRPGAADALQDLLAAEARLLAASPMAIMPEVGINIARAVDDATGPSDVLAYPARIVGAGDRFVRPAPPAFGASNHLAACLEALRVHDPSLHAVANIRGGPDIAAAVQPDVTLDGPGERLVLIRAAVSGSDRSIRTIHDPGAVGIEPCLYVAGTGAVEVVHKIIEIAEKVRT